jgi:hypothetical protein
LAAQIEARLDKRCLEENESLKDDSGFLAFLLEDDLNWAGFPLNPLSILMGVRPCES